MMPQGELRIARPAELHAAAPIRRAASTFLEAMDVPQEQRLEIIIAIGEAIANAVEHAYSPSATGDVQLSAHFSADRLLSVDIADEGKFIQRERRPGRGFGLTIMQGLARNLAVETDNGTTIHMTFQCHPERSAA
jgi:anti-sigma regulatory factor (Ser/Thr protein kinase)